MESQAHVVAVSVDRVMRRFVRRWITGYLFIAPWLIGVTVFFVYPIVASFYYSFTEYDVFRPSVWVGTLNYQRLLKDQYFLQALHNTTLYVVFAVPGALLSGFIHALLLNAHIRGQQVFRTSSLLPNAVAIAASAAVWSFIWNPGQGLINKILGSFSLPRQTWMADPVMVKWIFISITIYTGMGMLVFLAALQNVPIELYDAARVDGANVIHQMIHITIPMVTPSLLFNLLMGLIGAFQYFAFPMLMTQGGPVGGSMFYGQYLYMSAFEFFKMGYASAQAWILFLICGTVVFLVFRSSARWVYYEVE